MPRAYYNEHDPRAAAWLRELIARDLIAPGVVDERSIADVIPSDLEGFTQCHFFAGIGVWSHALRQAGWRDDRPVWTGSCPCQPFSVAGARKRFDDERHLWPEFYRLIRERRPDVCFGEQVASKAGLNWLDLVSADLESSGYAVGAVDTCAAGVGAPHIRQRLYWVADSSGSRPLPSALTRVHRGETSRGPWDAELEGSCSTRAVADDDDDGRARLGASRLHGQRESGDDAPRCGATRGVGNAECAGLEGHGGHGDNGQESRRLGALETRPASASSDARELGDPSSGGRGERRDAAFAQRRGHADGAILSGFWSAADWLACTDGKARPIEPGTFPLAHGAPARVGRLRGYGNALCAPQAIAFIEAYLDVADFS